MFNWNNVDLLEIVEYYAETGGGKGRSSAIASEEDLSERFDEGHEDWLHDNCDDQIMIDEEFNNWSDALCKDGELHPEQYSCYTYVGKYAEKED